MYIEFKLPQDGVEGDIKAFDAEGKEVQVSRITYTPYFFTASAIPAVLFASLFSGVFNAKKKPKVQQRAAITVSGGKGHMRLQDRTRGVTPQCEDTNEPAADNAG